MKNRNLTRLVQQSTDLDEIADVLDREEKCRSTVTDAKKGTNGTKYERTLAQKRRKENVRRARELKEKLITGESESPHE